MGQIIFISEAFPHEQDDIWILQKKYLQLLPAAYDTF